LLQCSRNVFRLSSISEPPLSTIVLNTLRGKPNSLPSLTWLERT
jgi:hypothetical protein